jgi:hypothetical protein
MQPAPASTPQLPPPVVDVGAMTDEQILDMVMEQSRQEAAAAGLAPDAAQAAVSGHAERPHSPDAATRYLSVSAPSVSTCSS